MRIWSLHPALLDSKGLVACWRETLLAQKVLQGLTKGYKNHPQLERFKAHSEPLAAITTYLHGLADEANARGYKFDRSRIVLEANQDLSKIPVTSGQLEYELEFLRLKVQGRDPHWFHEKIKDIQEPKTHPVFYRLQGNVEFWEKVKDIQTKN